MFKIARIINDKLGGTADPTDGEPLPAGDFTATMDEVALRIVKMVDFNNNYTTATTAGAIGWVTADTLVVSPNEVKNGIFKLPKEIVFELNKNQHLRLEKEVLNQKGIVGEGITHFNDFDVSIFDIIFRFKVDEN